MTLGLMLPYSCGLPIDAMVEVGARAEAAGYEWLIVNEFGNDALITSAALGMRTQRATIATGIVNIGLRHPALAGASAAQLLALTRGRFVLGLGIGHREANTQSLGLPQERMHDRLVEYIAIVRTLASGEPAAIRGEFYTADGVRLGHPTPEWPLRTHVGLLNLGAARRLAPIVDGFMLNFAPVEYAARLVETVRESAAAAGRDPASVVVSAFVHVLLGRDRQAPGASRAVARQVAHYTRLTNYRRALIAAGFERDIAAIEQARAAGGAEAASLAVTDALLDAIFVTSDLAGYLAQLRAVGVELPVLYPYPVDMTWQECFEEALQVPGAIGAA